MWIVFPDVQTGFQVNGENLHRIVLDVDGVVDNEWRVFHGETGVEDPFNLKLVDVVSSDGRLFAVAAHQEVIVDHFPVVNVLDARG